ncbi:MAG: deoxyribonuclease IV [Candidatus Bipolaricaulia bacterium]
MSGTRVERLPLLGCHLSIAKGFVAAIDEAEALGNNALQIFTHNASAWRMKSITADRAAEFVERRASSSIEFIVAHTMYLLNLASPDDHLFERSVDALIEEVRRAGLLGLDAVVTHLGAHVGSGLDRAMDRIVRALDRVSASDAFVDASGVRLLLENTAGSGTTIGSTFEELAEILSRVDDAKRLGICLDTAHAFAAGYDLQTECAVEESLAAFDATIGIDRLGLIHLNDSKYACGSRRDRHEHIGWGEIGREGLGAFVRQTHARSLPLILETPKKADGRGDADRMNLAAARMLLEGPTNEQEGS